MGQSDSPLIAENDRGNRSSTRGSIESRNRIDLGSERCVFHTLIFKWHPNY